MNNRRLSTKEIKKLQKLNAVVNSIDRVIDYGLQIMKQATTDDLKLLKEQICRRRKELIG